MWNLRTLHKERGVHVRSSGDALINDCFGFSLEKMETYSGRLENKLLLKIWGISEV